MNGFTQVNELINTNNYINSDNNYSLNETNLSSICECIESNREVSVCAQQLAFDQFNKDYREWDFDPIEFESNTFTDQYNQYYSQLNHNSIDNSLVNSSLISTNFNTNNSINDFNAINTNSCVNNQLIVDNCVKNNNKSVNNIKPNKKAAKVGTNKKTSRKESSSNNCRNPKPVSAYALFFRDAQSVIKSSNPSASFGDISKVVANNWEQLDNYNKNIYKQRADQEKKNYLKSLASSRAKQIAGLMDQSVRTESNPLQTMNDQNAENPSVVGFVNQTNPQTERADAFDSEHNLNSITTNPSDEERNVSTTSEPNNALPKQHCIRSGCGNDAIDSIEWDSEYCSSECCVKHCSDVFQDWVQKQQFAPNTNA